MLPLVAAIALAAAQPAGEAAVYVTFRTPSKNIACAYYRDAGPGSLRCDILSGLRPRPRTPCEVDLTGLSLPTVGRAGPTCAGDTVYDPRSRILGYGQTWRRDGIRCVSQRSGPRCTNPSGRGFFLARERWRVF